MVLTILLTFSDVVIDYDEIESVNVMMKIQRSLQFDERLKTSIINMSNQKLCFKIKKMQSNNTLKSFFEVSQGLIPYDKYRGHSEETIKNRIWHSEIQKDETFKRELKGGDVGKYSLNWNGKLWISYGSWLAAPRRQDFFTKPRILIREITNPYILATYTEEEYYNTPPIINIIEIKDIKPLVLLGIISREEVKGYPFSKPWQR